MSSSPDDKASASMSYSKITRIVLTIAILLDFLVISGLSFYSIIKSNEAEIANNEGLIEDSSLRTLIVTSDGVIYSAWVERTAEESKIVFGKSTDFGKSWKQDVALNVSNVGIQATEKRFDDISLMIDRSGFAHITFMKNLRSPSAYGDAYLWTLSYITNKGGNWSAPEEVKGPWNSDFKTGFSVLNTGSYSEGVRGVQLDIDQSDVLHIASRHQGWWAWGHALYHHFKNPNAEWKTEQVRWKQAGVGTYEVMRQFYILKKLADEDQFFAGVSPTANRLISDLSSQRIREYRGDAGDVAFNKCWNPQGNTIDCVVQDLPLLVVSPRGELYIFNGREDDSHAYFQSIPASTFWAHNTLKNSEIDISHTEEWGPYTRFLDPIEIEPNQLVKAVFDPAGRPHVAAISKDSKSIYYSNDLKKTEVVFVSTSAVRDIDIAIVDNVAHVLASENDPGGRRIWDFSRTPEGGWNRILIGSSAGQFEAPPRNEINVARHSAGPSGHYTLPFAAVSWIESNGTLRFRRIGAVPFQLQIDALKKLVLYFVLSSMTVLAIFLTAEILISRKQPLSQRLAVGYLIALVIFLIAKDVYSWHLRNELFLAPDPYVILGSLGGLVAILYAFVSNFLKIVEALRKAASTSPT